jgi:hypothetical protein
VISVYHFNSIYEIIFCDPKLILLMNAMLYYVVFYFITLFYTCIYVVIVLKLFGECNNFIYKTD